MFFAINLIWRTKQLRCFVLRKKPLVFSDKKQIELKNFNSYVKYRNKIEFTSVFCAVGIRKRIRLRKNAKIVFLRTKQQSCFVQREMLNYNFIIRYVVKKLMNKNVINSLFNYKNWVLYILFKYIYKYILLISINIRRDG